MIKVNYVHESAERVRDAAKYTLQDGWYVLTDDSGDEKCRAQAKGVRSIRKTTNEDEAGPVFGFA